MKYIILTVAVFMSLLLKAQVSYNYDNLADSLKKNVDYIVWEDLMEFEIHDKGKATQKVKYAVCIIDQYSKAFNTIQEDYDNDDKISYFRATIYNKNGKEVKVLKKSEIKDVSANSGYSLFEDDRLLQADFIHNEYPYTLVYEYKKEINGLLYYPSWYFHGIPNSTVLLSEFKIITPKDFKFKYLEHNLKNKVEITNQEKKTIYTWKEENLLPFEPVDLSPPIELFLPIVYTAPISFIESGFEGDMSSWEKFGYWRLKLKNGRDSLSEDAIKKVKELTANIKTNKEKVKILYEFLQNNTRYVSVQEGIGGWQPFPANYVYKNGYGDCKALSNYMSSLLKTVGIKSYYAVIKAGRNADDIDPKFVRNQTNHAILCVPQEKDTIWLECTDQQQPFNFLGRFTDDRHALLITEDGGKLVKTPRYKKELNTQYRKVDIQLDVQGNAEVKVNTEFKGLQYENREGWVNEDAKEQKDRLKKVYPVSGMEIKNYKFTEYKDEIPSIIENLDLSIMRCASVTGKRMFLKINMFNQEDYVPKNEERKIPFELTYEFIDVDSVQIEIPQGYEIESNVKPVDIQTKFGNYSVEVVMDGNKLLYLRKFSSEKGIFPASDYKDFYDFRKEVKKSDASRLVLVRKE